MAIGSLDMDVDSPPHLPMETSANKFSLLSFLCHWFHYSFHIYSFFSWIVFSHEP
ncbi:hypothetical protein PAHAL_3G176700 [Panicum hallii]|uniref:Uncharacterized protein n=1 Tax=Panicum hallii TaxID=206008 RepID=A0A2T8KIJ1_9POAL|nr:hypothetical protein PAHAL_3G176700 [Panicum hallii]